MPTATNLNAIALVLLTPCYRYNHAECRGTSDINTLGLTVRRLVDVAVDLSLVVYPYYAYFVSRYIVYHVRMQILLLYCFMPYYIAKMSTPSQSESYQLEYESDHCQTFE
jgi:hypothetical protein